MSQRLEAIVSGRVQMVMFRDFVQRKSSTLKLVGEVQNLRDGTVRIIAEGPQEKLQALEKKLHHGPILAHVEDVRAEWKDATNEYTKFTITYAKD